MNQVLNLKRKKNNWLKYFLVVLGAVVLTTVGIKASDSYFNSEKNDGSGGPCPSDMVLVNTSGGAFCLDKYENSASGQCPYGNPQSQTATKDNLDSTGCQPLSVEGTLPWRNISQNQAEIACAKAGKRLPTAKEWQQGALGTPDLDSGWSKEDCQVASNWTNQPGLSGSATNCVSAAGAYDMIGNVWEWVEGTINEGSYDGKTLPLSGYIKGADENAMPIETATDGPDDNYYGDYFWIKAFGDRGIAKGGYWDSAQKAGQYATYSDIPPSFAGVGVGFRCAKSAL